MSQIWSNSVPAVQFRMARPTHQMDKIINFYHKGLGLEIVGSFKDHDGYDGIMFGLPSVHYHLEFTQHTEAKPTPPPSDDNLLVFYIPDTEARDALVNKLTGMGYRIVEPENPYWNRNGVTIADPDGWRIVLQNTSGLS